MKYVIFLDATTKEEKEALVSLLYTIKLTKSAKLKGVLALVKKK